MLVGVRILRLLERAQHPHEHGGHVVIGPTSRLANRHADDVTRGVNLATQPDVQGDLHLSNSKCKGKRQTNSSCILNFAFCITFCPVVFRARHHPSSVPRMRSHDTDALSPAHRPPSCSWSMGATRKFWPVPQARAERRWSSADSGG